jgi:dipeptidase
MAKKSRHPNFDQTLEILRAHSFDVAPCTVVAGGFLVSKGGVGAVLVAHEDEAAMAVTPGALVRGQVARLLDRGYQKFIKSSQYELPATASQLQAIHSFSEELKQLTGAIDLYNEALGTTSDSYQYDRLKGRQALQPAPARPWDLTGGH